METPAIDIKGLTKSYGELKALNGVNISIKKELSTISKKLKSEDNIGNNSN